MNKNIALLLAVLSLLFPALASGDEGLAELAASKRRAALLLDIPGQIIGFGAFISDDGLALVDLGILALKDQPTVATAEGTRLKFGTILGLFGDQGVALMKFNHRPKVWLHLARKEPEVGETIALVTLNRMKMLDGSIPPVVGPVMAIRKAMTPNLREARFTRILSLGSGVSRQQLAFISAGCFAVDSQGDLIAFTNGNGVYPGQILVQLAPVVEHAARIAELAKGGKSIPFPLPEAINPLDPALLDGDYRRLSMAMQLGNVAKGKNILKTLLKNYPGSDTLKTNSLKFFDPSDKTIGMADFPEPKPGDPVAQQVTRFLARVGILTRNGDIKGAESALKSAVAISPEDFPVARAKLGLLYLNLDRPAEAETLFREAYASMPESIQLAEELESLLTKRSQFDEAAEFTKRMYALLKIYRH